MAEPARTTRECGHANRRGVATSANVVGMPTVRSALITVA